MSLTRVRCDRFLSSTHSGFCRRLSRSISVSVNPSGAEDIQLTSTCEHHFVTIEGQANVAYVPAKKVVGLSKINRVVRFFARRPQVQERLTRQVLVALQTLLDTDDVAVSINATHFCVKSRGVMDAASQTSTYALGGCFEQEESRRREFLQA